LEWLDRQTIDVRKCSTGLSVGLAGIAWGLLECGRQERALKVLSAAMRRSSDGDAHDLFTGRAGLGLTLLRAFRDTGDERYLQAALDVGEALDRVKERAPIGVFWRTPLDTAVQHGLGHGAAGIALFLAYLAAATRQERWLDLGRQGLDFELSRSVVNKDGGRSWQRSDQETNILLPYWRHGSAGIGAVLVRYAVLTREPAFTAHLEEIALDTRRKYAVFPGYHAGLSGIGQFWLDWWLLLGHTEAKRGADMIAAGLGLFTIERPGGIAFPGDGLTRLSCDLATGSAGVALFLDRLERRSEAPLFLDEWLLTEASEHRQPLGAGGVSAHAH
jgi:hypothetical protein